MALCLFTKSRKYFKKDKSFAHGEFNKDYLVDEIKIKEKIKKERIYSSVVLRLKRLI